MKTRLLGIGLLGATMLLAPLTAVAHPGHGTELPLHTLLHGCEPLLLALGIAALTSVITLTIIRASSD